MPRRWFNPNSADNPNSDKVCVIRSVHCAPTCRWTPDVSRAVYRSLPKNQHMAEKLAPMSDGSFHPLLGDSLSGVLDCGPSFWYSRMFGKLAIAATSASAFSTQPYPHWASATLHSVLEAFQHPGDFASGYCTVQRGGWKHE